MARADGFVRAGFAWKPYGELRSGDVFLRVVNAYAAAVEVTAVGAEARAAARRDVVGASSTLAAEDEAEGRELVLGRCIGTGNDVVSRFKKATEVLVFVLPAAADPTPPVADAP